MNKGFMSVLLRFFGLFLLALLVFGCGKSSNNDEPETMRLFPTDSPIVLSETEKLERLVTTTRPYPLEFSNPVTLYAATAPGQPLYHPADLIRATDLALIDETAVLVDTPPVYSKAYRNAFVQKGGDEQLWFALSVNSEAAVKLVWQVADRPFTLDRENILTPPGLQVSGELAAVNGEFMLDMVDLKPPRLAFAADNLIDVIDTRTRVYPQQDTFYVRAFALDNEGAVVGNFDRGLQVQVGYRQTYNPPLQSFSLPFDLLSGNREGLITFGEFPNELALATERFYGNDSLQSDWYFRPDGFPQKTDTLYLQVSTQPLTTGQDDWRDPPGLVHELELKKGTPAFDNFSAVNHAVAVTFPTFGVVPSRYYVRAVALSPGAVAGTVKANYSKTVIVYYAPSGESNFIIYPPPTQISPDIPDVRLLEYNPIKWEDSEWMYWFQVVRQPTYKEYTNGFSPSTALVPGLTVGKNIKFEPPNDDDNSWLEDAWNAVSNFFSSIVDYLSKVTNWVSAAYANAKAGLIEFAASNLPLIPDSLRDELQAALTYLVDYGLASVGIPPELPNFDQLTSLGADYMASVALESAGIPENVLINSNTLQDLGGGIKDELKTSASSGSSPNPLGWKFVRQRPDTLYRPAYILFEISNPHNHSTPPGILRGDVTRHLSDDELMDGTKATMVAIFGGSHDFELYRPVSGVVIPRLLPGQRLTVPLYLTEYTGQAFPFHPHVVNQSEFSKMYSHFDYFNFSFGISYDLPSAEAYAASKGLPGGIDYVYSNVSNGFGFSTDPAFRYVPSIAQ